MTTTRQHTEQGGPAGTSPARIAVTSMVGTAIEWYDFTIYGLTAALIFGPQFFPTSSSLASTLAAFATFGVGFLARPFGSVVMGHFGDRVGRKTTLITSLLLMGGATVLVGLLPTYQTIGVLAPILLVLLRFVQGIGIGGEWGGAVLIGVEHAPRGKRTLFGSFAQMGLPLGVAFAALTFLLMTAIMPAAAFSAGGWRIPFLLSAFLLILGLWVRLKITETRDFQKVLNEGTTHRVPISALLRQAPRTTILAGLASCGSPAMGILMYTYMLTYAGEQLHLTPSVILVSIAASAATTLPTALITARLSDRIGRKPIFTLGLLCIGLWVIPFFALVNTASVTNIVLAYLIGGIPLGMNIGPQAGLLADLFPAAVRYTGSSMGYQIGGILGGGLAPILSALLMNRFGSSLAIVAYILITVLISVVALSFLPDPRTFGAARNPAPATG